MLNDSGKRNPLQNAIYTLVNMPSSVTKAALHNITRPFGMMGDVFSRENIVNAMMPKTLAAGVNTVLDKVSASRKKAAQSTASTKKTESKKQQRFEEEDFDPSQGGWVEDDEYDDDGPVAASMRVDGSIDNIDEDVGESEELLAEILDEIQNGFGQSNENLGLLLERFGVNNDNEEPVMMRWDEQGVPDPVAKIDPDQLEELSDDDSMAELIELNGVIIKKLDQIEKNTRRDTLAEREAELESRSAKAVVSTTAEDLARAQKDKEGSLIGAIADGLGSAALGAAGLGAAGLGAKGAAGKLGKILGKTKAPASGLATAAAESKAGPAIAKSVEAAVKPASKLGAVTKGAGRVLGAPLAVGLSAYEAYQVSQDGSLSSEQKTTEYSKIGGKTVGALAGAKAGAVLGAIGGPVGSVIGGLLGGIGGFFLGEKGGEIVGDLINKVLPSSGSSPKLDDTAKAAEIAANIVKPEIGGVSAGNTRVSNLEQLTQRIEQTAADKQAALMQPIIAPVTIHNNNTTNNGSSNQQSRMPVPSVRNQDGTIQRLLDANYRPLIK